MSFHIIKKQYKKIFTLLTLTFFVQSFKLSAATLTLKNKANNSITAVVTMTGCAGFLQGHAKACDEKTIFANGKWEYSLPDNFWNDQSSTDVIVVDNEKKYINSGTFSGGESGRILTYSTNPTESDFVAD